MEKSRPIRNWNALEIYWDCKKRLSEKITHPCWFIAMPATTLDEEVFDKVPRPGIEPRPPGWEPGILTTRPSGRWWNWKEGNLMNTCFRMNWEAMWWSFCRISIASAESFFMRVQYTQNANVCNPITITSDQKHCPSSQISTFQIVTSLFTSHTKTKPNAIFRLKPSSLKSAFNRNFVKTEIPAMLAVVSLKSVYFATD